MTRWFYFIYGVGSHLMFLAVYAWLACFVGNFLVPKTIDSHPVNSLDGAVINLLLVALFGLQHSVMARPGFKQRWTKIVPQPIERSTYVLLSNLVVIFLMWQWRGLDTLVWNVTQPIARGLLWGLFAAGWLLVPAVSLMISHFDLFGIRQVWLHLRGKPYTALAFRTPWLYSVVRHPLYIGWFLAFWATPTMSLGHLLLAGGMTVYILIAVQFEERDLIDYFGAAYKNYRRRVPMFIPGLTPLKGRSLPNASPSGVSQHSGELSRDRALSESTH
jgi:methanethiol S-methyltransferase